MCSGRNRPFSRLAAVVASTALAASLVTVFATTVGSGAALAEEPRVPEGFALRESPSGQSPGDLTDFAYLPDGSVLTTGKTGKVAWVSTDGHSRVLRSLSVESQQDMGLVGLAVASDYETSRHIYLARSVPTGGGSYDLTLARWEVTGSPEPTGLTNETELLRLPGDANVHGITGIVADEDGTIWVSIGDVASYTEVDARALRAQKPYALQGKVLHLTADGRGVPGNPFYDPADPDSARSKIFASGFRSPFRLSLDPRSGLPILGDVGWNRWEEINLVQPGRDYGWPCWEGTEGTPGYRELPECEDAPNTAPLVQFRHGRDVDSANSVTGGVVYTGTSYPEEYRGAYFFGDYTHQKLWSLRYDDQGRLVRSPESPPLGTHIGRPVKFDTAANGDIVFADIGSGKLKRLTYTPGNQRPVAKVSLETDPETRTVTFDGGESFDFDGDPLTYHWDFGDGTSDTGKRVEHVYDSSEERFTATLTVTDAAGASGTAEVTVVPGNHTPRLRARTEEDRTYAVGETVSVSVWAEDDEDGLLDVSWQATVVHCPEDATCHSHPSESGEGTRFSVPFTDHPDSHMELTATATDSEGVSSSYTFTALPREHRLTLSSNVPAAVEIASEGDGDTSTRGGTAMVTAGATVSVAAAGTAADGESVFSAWENGASERTHTFTMPDEEFTLTALYATPVEQRYANEPGLRDILGEPTGPVVIDGDVYYREHADGRLYWSAGTGTHEVHGPIAEKYVELGGHKRFGPPTTDQTVTPDGRGRFNHFLGTPYTRAVSVYWTPETGAHAVWGEIRKRWAALRWERGPLGYPTTDESRTPDGIGRYNHFSKGGSVYWTPRTGAHAVYGAIRRHWASLGWERSYLGYPVSSEYSVTGGRRNDFQGGYIEWRAATDRTVDRRVSPS
ncbi:MAG: PQQ-dependent sugar dehydrogenase [Saccharomonospora viridis]|jgi:glucose/arabinose dehydrogenase|uniref:Glucose/sorbosone dehydrogenase n=1 Tax=Saccharomonospora viridis TaxID=1852 RepID=A0A837DB33_9PSEU|nr:PQQ-dependent sugar dehydrogenase [Saccharomonospora viridis]KHF44425.1 glucose/sorbosone dehydrogenase [Saccharomonospora viridis]SFP64327.1 Glucose/arabinose dehydrogenase, beta-propeller fold [Saccharomonospora viridis]